MCYNLCMTDNTPPARIFLSTLGSLMSDPTRRVAIDKHNTRDGRTGDSKAPGDPKGYRYAHPPHKEVGGVGTGEELPSQEPHGDRGMDNKGSVQTIMILLRAVSKFLGTENIASWNDLLGWSEADIWHEASHVFGSEQNVREIIDSLPKRSTGENINVDDVPVELIQRYYVGEGSKGSKPEPKPEPKPKPEPEPLFTDRDIPLLSEYLGGYTDQELEQGLEGLSDSQFEEFQSFSMVEKMVALAQIMQGIPFEDIKL